MLKEGETNFLTYLSKITPECSSCLQEPTDKIWNQNRHIQKKLEPFLHSEAGCLLTTVFRQTKIVLDNIFLNFFLQVFKYCLKNIFQFEKKKHNLIQFWFV